ncbi:Exocyst complex component 5 [Cladophialophora chaetospira]|uniref:Exocyst complex component 5 n=1 Tax=Cladophialophora chaetospira TaxID=386627 RepID=A0AA39CDS4_9EURO|nr:Exocyst complex component 5 [Cladophialophora chaetospira]
MDTSLYYSSSQRAGSPTQSRTIFPKGPIFNLDDFSSKEFIAKDFIESLTESAQSTSRRSHGPPTNAPFDPKPLIRAFEQASRRLDELSGELEQRENELSTAVRRAEAQHASNTETLGRKLNFTIASFQKLDTSLKSDRGEKWGGNVAVDTGRRIEELDRQRRKALDAHFLIECWDEVSNRGEVTLLENLRRSGTSEGKIRSANIARQLLRISQRLDPKSYSGGQTNGTATKQVGVTNGVAGARNFNTREIIEKFIETLENDMLKLFDDFYRRQNFDEMKNCAIVLQDFNGGASVQAAFVNQHQFFIDRSNLVTEEIGGDQETWMRLSDPDAEVPGVEPGLQSLIDEVKVVVQEESAIIKRAFPYPEQVLGKFVQRVFQQSIQQRLELVLEKAESESTLAYLRSLQAARSSISLLVDDLKAHGLTEHPDSVTSQTSTLLDTQLEELFTPYVSGSAYIDKEKHNLQELYKSLLFKFELFHSRRQKEPKTYLAAIRNRGQELLASAREATDAYVKSLDLEKMSPTQKRILLSVAGLKNTDEKGSATDTLEIDEEDGRLHILFAKRMLKWLAEGVRRGLELGGGSETPKDVAALLHLILNTLLTKYVELSLDASSELASSYEAARREPDLSYLANLRIAVHIAHLVHTCVNTLLTPLASSSLTTRREMEKVTRLAITRIEEQINNIEQSTIDAVLNWTTRLLSNQNRGDFRPRADTENMSLEQAQTQTCGDVCKFLGGFHDIAVQSFDGANLAALLLEVGVGVRGALLQHFTRWQVNRIGGVMLARDVSRYVQLLRSWDLDTSSSSSESTSLTSENTSISDASAGRSFKASLEVLSEIASVFVLHPEALKERLRGPVLGNLGRENLRPYLLRRDDYMEVGMQSLLASL